MRRLPTLGGVGALLLLAAAAPAPAQDAAPKPTSPVVCSAPEVAPLPDPPTERDLRDHALRHRIRSKECELEARRRADPEGMQSCYFGPELVRISNERYEEIRQAHKADPVELWHAILSEPEDPALPAIEIRITSKSGPNCKSDYERQLEAEVNALMKELNVR